MNITLVAGVALVALICVRVLQCFGSFGVLSVSLVGVVVLLLIALPSVGEILSSLRELALAAGVDSAGIGLVLRGLGIALITRFAAGVCRDCGQKTLSETVEYCGQVALVALALPTVMEMAKKFGELSL